MNELLKNLSDEFADGDYAHAYMESHTVSRLAAQVHALRKQRGWSQQDLAAKSGFALERIAKIESADFSSLTMTTLSKLARAFDIDLGITFQPFSHGLQDVANLDSKALEVTSRQEDLQQLREQLAIAENLLTGTSSSY